MDLIYDIFFYIETYYMTYINKLTNLMKDCHLWILLLIIIIIVILFFIPNHFEPLTNNIQQKRPSGGTPGTVSGGSTIASKQLPTKLTSASFTPSTTNKYKSISNYNQDILSSHGAFNAPITDNRNLALTKQQIPSMNNSWGYKGPTGSSVSQPTTIQPTKPYADYKSMITYSSNVNNQSTCSYSIYGCCPDNTTAKSDASGSNCPMCSDGITYYTDLSGTNCPVNYGMCGDGVTPKIDASGSNCPMCSNGTPYTDASGTNCPGYYGMCQDTVTYKLDMNGSNCPMCPDGKNYYLDATGSNCLPAATSCLTSQYGCCPDGKTAKTDTTGNNCMAYMLSNQLQTIESKLDNNCHFSEYGCCLDGTTKKKDVNGTNCSSTPNNSYMPSTIYIPPPTSTGTSTGTTSNTTSGTTSGTTTDTSSGSSTGTPSPNSSDSSLSSMFGTLISDIDNSFTGSGTGSSTSGTSTSNTDSSTSGTSTSNTGSSIFGTTGNLTGNAKQPMFTPMYLNDSPTPTSCGTCPSCPDPPPCPPCARCPEPNFKCEKVPSYEKVSKGYNPKPLLNDFSQFARFQ